MKELQGTADATFPDDGGLPKSLTDVDSTLKGESGKEIKVLLVCFLTLLNSVNAICLAGAKRGHAEFPFEYVSVTLLQETSKLFIASSCFCQARLFSGSGYRPAAAGDSNAFRWEIFLLYAVPGLLYALDNNFQYVILRFIKPAELTILWNFKIVMTAVLLRVLMNHPISSRQWWSLGVLVMGCLLTQLPNFVEQRDAAARGGAAEVASHWKLIGALLAVVASSIMAGSNIFLEWLVKRRPQDSIHYQNMQLYFFGMTMNAVVLLVKVHTEADSPMNGPGGLFTGYTLWTWCVLIVGSVSGLFVSVVLKYIDNIALVCSHVCAMIVISIVSAIFFDFKLSGLTLVGIIFVACGIFGYYGEDAGHVLSKVKRLFIRDKQSSALWAKQKQPDMYCLNGPRK